MRLRTYRTRIAAFELEVIGLTNPIVARMRILFVGTSMEIGGIETNLARLAAALARRSHRVTVVSSGGPLAADVEHAGARHVAMPIGLTAPVETLRTAMR